MAFLVFAAGPTPARFVAAEVAARLGSMCLQQLHQRVVRSGACAAQQPQSALDITAIRSDAGQIDQGQWPVGIHRLGRQQWALGLVDVADSLQCHRTHPPTRHSRRARHLRLQHLGEQAQRGRAAAVGIDSLGHQQLGQQRVGKLAPELSDRAERALISTRFGAIVGRDRLVRIARLYQDLRDLVVQADQRGEHQCVVEVEVVSRVIQTGARIANG
jgi:hypothetical protein